MVTLVGTQNNFSDALKELIELDYDAIETYEAAINRLDNPEYKIKFAEFRDDHKRHVRELSDILIAKNIEVPTGPSMMKQMLTQGKVVLAQMMGDDAILAAMSSNEDDTNTAYDRMLNREDKWAEAVTVLENGRVDERRHKEWLKNERNGSI